MKKISIVFLIIFVITLFPLYRVEATPLAIPVGAKILIGAGLVAAGVYADTSEGLNYSVNDCWESFSDDVKYRWIDMGLKFQLGYEIMQEWQWSAIRGYAQSKYTSGLNNVEVNQTLTDVESLAVGDGCTYVKTGTGAEYYIYIKNGNVYWHESGGYNRYIEAFNPNKTYEVTTWWSGTSWFVGISVNGYYPPQWACQISGGIASALVPILHTYTGDAALGNPAWDWDNPKTGEKKIPGLPLPNNQAADDYLDGLVGKTKEDVINGDIGNNLDGATGIGDIPGVVEPGADLPNADIESGTITGWLSSLWDLIKQGYVSVLNALKVLWTSLKEIVDFLNPNSDKFFLKTFLVGTSEFLPGAFDGFWDSVKPKFPTELYDLSIPFEEKEIDWTVTIGGNILPCVTFQLIPQEVIAYRDTIKDWIGGVLIFFTFLYTLKKLPEIPRG